MIRKKVNKWSNFTVHSFLTWWMSCLTHTIRCTVGRNSNFRGATLMVVIYCYWQYRIWNGFYVLFQDTFLWIIEHYLFLSKQTKSFMLFQLPFFLKFIYSENATKFCKISTLLLSYVVPVKSRVEILQNFVAFSKYMNFTFLEIFPTL